MEPFIEKEVMNDWFTKFHVKDLGVDLVIHKFRKEETGENWHDHPYSFNSFIIKGGYVEEIKSIGPRGKIISSRHTRLPGTSHRVEASTIHRIVEFLEDGVVTVITPGPWEQETNFYRFDGDEVYSRLWNEEEFKPYTTK